MSRYARCTCHQRAERKAKAYGGKRIRVWCDYCDANLVPPKPNKKRARQVSKKLERGGVWG